MGPPTRGARTSEFWGGYMAPFAGVAALIHEFDDIPTRIAAIAGGTAVACVFIWSRTRIKEPPEGAASEEPQPKDQA